MRADQLDPARRPSTRTLSDSAIAVATSAGLIGLTIISLYFHALWKIGLVFVTLSAFGAVAIFDRSAIRPRWLFFVLRTTAAIVGGLASFALLLVGFEFALRNLKY